MAGIKSRSLTIKGNGILRAITCDVQITKPHEGKPTIKITGLWDTGATGTVITQKVVNALKLVPIGRTKVSTASGVSEVNKYMIDLHLPSGVTVGPLSITEGILSGCDCLIGMDIIDNGDLSLTNFKGKTCFSFRIPSQHRIDYVTGKVTGDTGLKQNKPPKQVRKKKRKKR